ncbi:hypothetical protein SK128_012921 [Halocaridina rubra]|uniref:Uncharacterized protein n=1 Tax=Halocaridina rubra TaxID=373956 RepID=A0AAN8WPF8_HALRR
MEETEEEYFGPARNIGELSLACIELASQVEAIDAEEEKVALLKEHIITYTQNEIPMSSCHRIQRH